MKRIIIHAGPGKTGTSAIQHWCTEHSEALRAQGVFYPPHDSDTNNVSSGNLHEVLERDEEGELYVSRKRVGTLLDRFAESGCHTLLLSSEFFYFKILELDQALPNAEFIAYLRDPIELAESGYNQSVKRHSHTGVFRISHNFRSGVLQHLKKLLSEPRGVHLSLRPYVDELYHGGSLVNDFLHAVGVNHRTDEDVSVNSSYSFEALEFKRHANHFPLGPLEPKLDRALQRCPIGDHNYSLTPPKRHEAIHGYLLGELDALLDLCQLDALKAFRDHLEHKPQRPFRPQSIKNEQLATIAGYLREEEPGVYDSLANLVRGHNHLALPNPYFYDCFDVVPSVHEPPIGVKEIIGLSRLLEENPSWKAADIAREIALFFERNDDFERAKRFMEAAHELRPHGEAIRSKLNEYRTSSKANGA